MAYFGQRHGKVTNLMVQTIDNLLDFPFFYIKNIYVRDCQLFVLLSLWQSLKSTENQLACIKCLALSLDFASSENNVTSFIAHISPLSLNQSRLKLDIHKLTNEQQKGRQGNGILH